MISVYIGGSQLAELAAEPGQFFRWRFLTSSLWWSSHPYSLSAAPGKGILRITVKDVGDHSEALAALRPGTRVFAEGPYGSFTSPARAGAWCCWPEGWASPRCAPCSRRCPAG